MDTIPDFFKQKEVYRNPAIDILIDEGFDRDQVLLCEAELKNKNCHKQLFISYKN